jgi:SET domain-containing protein
LADAGTGAFARKHIRANTVLAEYHGGPQVTIEQVEASDYRSLYAYTNHTHNLAIDPIDQATGQPTCLAAYINDPLDAGEANTEFRVVNDRVVVVALTDITPKSELFLYYGADYWTDPSHPSPLRERAKRFYDSPAGPRSVERSGVG